MCAVPSLPAIVGFAKTARVRAASPASVSLQEVRSLRLSYYEYIAAGPQPCVVLIEDTDWPRPVGAFWGEVNVAIHKGLKVAGAVTSGLIRDLGAIDKDFQLIAMGVSPSHAFVHVTDFGNPVKVLGMHVTEGDLIHADRHGAVVIPASAFAGITSAIDLATRKEKPVLAAARAEGFNIERLRQAWGDAEDIH